MKNFRKIKICLEKNIGKVFELMTKKDYSSFRLLYKLQIKKILPGPSRKRTEIKERYSIRVDGQTDCYYTHNVHHKPSLEEYKK